jgi:hypothetical protein
LATIKSTLDDAEDVAALLELASALDAVEEAADDTAEELADELALASSEEDPPPHAASTALLNTASASIFCCFLHRLILSKIANLAARGKRSTPDCFLF